MKHFPPQRIAHLALVIHTDDTGNIARIIPNCQTQEHIQYPLLALFSNNYSKYCKGRRSLDSQFFRLLGLLFFLRISTYQYKLDCNKLTRGPSESMHSDNTALLACMKYSWKLNPKMGGFCSNIHAFPGAYLEFSKLSTARSVGTSHEDQLSSWAPSCLARSMKGILMPKGILHPSLCRSVKTSREIWLMRHSSHTETE